MLEEDIHNLTHTTSHNVTHMILGRTAIAIPQKTAVLAMAGVSLFALMYLLSNIFWWTMFSSGFLVAIHAFLRDASMHKDLDDAMAMEGDFNPGEESSFLGSGRV